jgi:hypothetical protein
MCELYAVHLRPAANKLQNAQCNDKDTFIGALQSVETQENTKNTGN